MASNKRPGPQLSRVWEYFEEVENGHKCQLLLEDASPCEKVIKNKVTHNAEEHVRVYHFDFYGAIEKEKEQKKQKKTTNKATLPSSRQLTITDSFRGLSQSHFDEKIAKFFGGTTVSYNLIRHPVFRDLIHSLNPNVKIPKSITGVYTRVDNLFNKMKQKMREDLMEAKKITIMVDIWTKRFLVDSFLGVSTVFFSRKSQKRRVVALAVRKFRHPHTADALISMEKCPTLPGVIPSILSIESELDELGNKYSDVRDLCEWIVVQLKERFDFVFNPKNDHFDPIYFLATLLQPEYCWLLDSDQVTKARTLLNDLMQTSNVENSQSNTVDMSESSQENTGGVSLRFQGLEKRLRDKLISQQQAQSITAADKNPIDEQFERYFAIYGNASAARKSIDPLEFWITHSSEYPQLADFAQDLMCVPSGTAMQERIFSTCGIACSGRRLRLNGSQLEKETMITKNYDYYC